MSTAGENQNNFNSTSAGDYSDSWGISDGSVNQAMQSYLRELGQIPRLTPEEQDALKRRILQAENHWREILYSFAFTARLHREYLSGKDPGQWRDFFIPSVWQNGEMIDTLKKQQEKISNAEQQLHNAFQNHDISATATWRQELIELQMQSKLCCDILNQSYKQLLTAIAPGAENLLQVFAEESCYTVEEFKNKLNEAISAHQELQDLRQKMIEANLRLVVRIVNQYSYRNLSVSDLVQEGNIGLMRSLEKFDFNLNHKFSTYAS